MLAKARMMMNAAISSTHPGEILHDEFLEPLEMA
jgi:plasmid maintenance system antidote protein VapI